MLFVYIYIYIYIYRGTDNIIAPHGIPMDLLDRLLIIRTLPYNRVEMESILKLRVQTEGHSIESDALHYLAEVGTSTTLRYSIISKIYNFVYYYLYVKFNNILHFI